MFDLVTVGHLAIDSILLPGRPAPFIVLGGSAAYASLAAKRLDARVSLFSKVGGDFPEAYRWWLQQEGVDLSGLRTDQEALTTRFVLNYGDLKTERVLLLKAKAPTITVDDLPGSLRADAIHLAPLAGEISYDVAERLKGQADVLSLDLQGLVRNFDADGGVTLAPLTNRSIMGLVDILKSSKSEIEVLTGLPDVASAIESVHKQGIKIVIVTLGLEGAVVSVDGTVHKIPAYRSENVVDPTGAGDAFMGGFLAEYVYGENYLRCGCVGSAVASLVVEGLGPMNFGDKAEIYRRARLLYEKEIKE